MLARHARGGGVRGLRERALRIVYFHSDTHPYDKAIYPGVGPAFARPLGWETRPISRIGEDDYDLAVVDHRIEAGDAERLRMHLSLPAGQRQPIFFRVSDSVMPETSNPNVRLIFDHADHPGVHYATTYEPAGPMLAFTRTLAVSRVAHLPYAYDVTREVELPLDTRRRRIFLSGSNSSRLYPPRHALRRARRWNPVLRWYVFDLKHPGYPEHGRPPRHDVTHARFIGLASRFTHFFLCGTRYNVELMKYVECAYAGCVPVGIPAGSLSAAAMQQFRPYTGRTFDLVADIREALSALERRAAAYRSAMRALRAPERIVADFVAQATGPRA